MGYNGTSLRKQVTRMQSFMNKDFLLTTETAKALFHGVAEGQPIFDWHCHLSAKEIYENKPAADLYELWLTGDHYKWRAMRCAGVPERLVTAVAGHRQPAVPLEPSGAAALFRRHDPAVARHGEGDLGRNEARDRAG